MTITPTPEQLEVISAPLGPDPGRCRRRNRQDDDDRPQSGVPGRRPWPRAGTDSRHHISPTRPPPSCPTGSGSCWRRTSRPGREVEVHTYHGFAAQLLREFGALVGVERSSKVITPTFSRQLLEIGSRIGFPCASLNISDPNNIEYLRRLGSQLGDHLLLPEDVAIPDELPTSRGSFGPTCSRASGTIKPRRAGSVSPTTPTSSSWPIAS